MINGILNVYKEKGYTSHDVVAKLRAVTGQKKIGHTGTLDPDACGVLPVCFGRATKLSDMLSDKSKTYEAGLLLGVSTDTQDSTGTVLEKKPTDHLTEEQVLDCIHEYIGEYAQLPPMYSAVKVGGKKLYELARKGITVERKPRIVTIHAVSVTEMKLPFVRMKIDCSKGTYIRTLCHDIGAKLGVGGCMDSLLRTRVGQFLLEDSLGLTEAARLFQEGFLDQVIIPPDAVFQEYRAVTVRQTYCAPVYNGNPFPREWTEKKETMYRDEEQVRVYDPQGTFIGIFRYISAEGRFLVEKMFYPGK